MARVLGGNEDKVFRAAVTVKLKDGETFTVYRGPFLSKGQATTAIGRMKREVDAYGWTWWLAANCQDVESVEGVVEVSPLDWRPA